MKTIFGKLPGSSAAVRVDFEELIQAVDEIINRAEAAAVEEYISPGFIDIQVNGFSGVDFNDPATPHEDLRRALRHMATTGVTRCLPTVITGSMERMSGALRNLAAAKEVWEQQGIAEGPMFTAFHMEGPHISPEDGPRGAHPKAHVRPPNTEEFDRMQEAARGYIRFVTLSPEWNRRRITSGIWYGRAWSRRLVIQRQRPSKFKRRWMQALPYQRIWEMERTPCFTKRRTTFGNSLRRTN